MANNYGPLPVSGPISLEDIADVFFLYKAYPDIVRGRLVDMTDYYGDKIQYYTPLQPPIPIEASRELSISDFRGKRYGLLVDVFINAPINNYNLYDYAQARVNVLYPGFLLSNPAVPFFITLTNNSSVGSVSVSLPALSIGTSSNNVNSLNQYSSVAFINNGSVVGATAIGGARSQTYGPGGYSWTIPAGVTSVNVRVVAGGGGGGTGQEVNNGGAGGGGGSGGTNAGTISVSPGGGMSISVGGGGGGGQSGGRGTSSSGRSGGGTTVSYGSASVGADGGGGGGGGGQGSGGKGGNGGSPNGARGGNGQGGNNDYASGTGGGGGGSVYGGYGAGGKGADFYDRSGSLGWSGSGGGGGVAILDYVINIPGGPSVQLTRPTTIINNGLIAGGISSIGSAGAPGAYIIGYSNVLNKPVGGRVSGRVQ